ncbi:MAG: hypothetical protein R2694_19590 [Ilumatobacteraceae bacterium]
MSWPSRWWRAGGRPTASWKPWSCSTATWVVAAQWHPEDTATHKPQQQAIYDELIRRAAARAAGERLRA